MENKDFRIISYDNTTYNVIPIRYFDTYEEANEELKRLVEEKECEKELFYFIQSKQPVPVKSKDEREQFLERVRKISNSFANRATRRKVRKGKR